MAVPAPRRLLAARPGHDLVDLRLPAPLRLPDGTSRHLQTIVGADGADDEGVQVIAGFVFVFLFYMAAILFGYAIANSVVEEKQSRIVEILAAAIPLRQLLVGKVVGATALALGQMVIFVAIGLIGEDVGLFWGGDYKQLVVQVVIALFALVFTGVLTAIIALVLKPLGWRVSDEDEKSGIDEAEHAETAYELA